MTFEEYNTKEYHEKNLKLARESEPEGVTCHFCKLPNDFADDCGFFYIMDPNEPETRCEKGYLTNKSYPACESCYRKHSWKHTDYYGLGER